jgi:hypothetical protein
MVINVNRNLPFLGIIDSEVIIQMLNPDFARVQSTIPIEKVISCKQTTQARSIPSSFHRRNDSKNAKSLFVREFRIPKVDLLIQERTTTPATGKELVPGSSNALCRAPLDRFSSWPFGRSGAALLLPLVFGILSLA